jgi:plastocyanin
LRTTLATVVVLNLLVGNVGSGSGTEVRGVVRAGDRVQANVVVWFTAATASPDSSARARPVLDQRNLSFSPQVLAVRVGQTVDFPNNDRVFHNVFSFRDGKRFDLGVYPVGARKAVVFDRPGVSRLFCNIHPGMAAYVVAVNTPYFSVSDEEGRFSVALPAGTYTYHAWRAGASELTGAVTVSDVTSLDIRWP